MTGPGTRIVDKVTVAGCWMGGTILFGQVTKVSIVQPVGDEIRLLFVGRGRCPLGDVVRLGAIGVGNGRAIIEPAGGRGKEFGQLVTMLLPPQSHVGPQRRVPFEHKEWNVRALFHERSQPRGGFHRTAVHQQPIQRQIGFPNFGGHVRAGNVRIVILFRFHIIIIVVVAVVVVVHIRRRPAVTPIGRSLQGGLDVDPRVIQSRCRVVKIVRQAGVARFDGHGNLQEFRQQNLQDPRAQKTRFPSQRQDAHFLIPQGRGSTIAAFQRFRWIARVASANVILVIVVVVVVAGQQGVQASSMVKRVAANALETFGTSETECHIAIQGADAGNLGLDKRIVVGK
mmetsp:Transcript_9803/g.21247  ORF Transcript_9803/g.21247 Transcript_9803/m.21247 type:complete len:341 (-) Transcript_9803:283-1305(-)